MKKQSFKLIISFSIMGLNALPFVNAQQWTTSGTNIYNSNSGSVGIGITTPAEKLHVNGNIRGGSSGGSLRVSTGNGYLDIGPQNSSWCHLITDRNSFYFGKPIQVNGDFGSYNGTNLNIGIGSGTTINRAITVLASNRYVGIGTLSPLSKLHVSQYATITDGSSQAAGLFEWTIPSGSAYSGSAIGAKGVVTSSTFGGEGTQYQMVGVFGEANSPTPAPPVFSLYHYGVIGHAHGFQVSYGGYFYATGTGNRIGVYGDGANWGVYSNGNTYCTGVYQGSDMKLKNNIKPITSALDKIKQLKPSSYNYKAEEFKLMNLPVEKQMGLVAQDVEKVFPELVKVVAAMEHKDEEGNVISSNPEFKAVNYTGLIPVLIAAMQDQQKVIEEMKNEIASIKATTDISHISLNNGAVLFQNTPNPFGGETVINYVTPANSQAQIIFYDELGRKIKDFNIDQRGGTGQLNISSLDLVPGIYSYSLFVNGINVETKKMIKQ